MTKFEADYRIDSLVEDLEIEVKRYAKIILNLSRIGNQKGANFYRTKLSETRNSLKYLRMAL
jgi:hypothetical protein